MKTGQTRKISPPSRLFPSPHLNFPENNPFGFTDLQLLYLITVERDTTELDQLVSRFVLNV